MKIKCKVCEKIMSYNGKDSPMLKSEFWNKVVNYFNLKDYEIKSANKFVKNYKRGSFIMKDDEHLFICKECMQKVLGEDLKKVYLDCPFNKDN